MAGPGDDILGRWSVEAGTHSAMEDEEWRFLPDRTGSSEYARPFFSVWVLFRWAPVAADVIRLEPYRAVTEADGGTTEDEIPAPEEVRYRIVREDRHLWVTPMPVLYLPASFTECPEYGYGLVTRTPDTSRWPV